MISHELYAIDDTLRFEQMLIQKYQHYSASCNDQQLKVALEKIAAKHALQYEQMLRKLN